MAGWLRGGAGLQTMTGFRNNLSPMTPYARRTKYSDLTDREGPSHLLIPVSHSKL